MQPYLLKEEELKELSIKIPKWNISSKYIQRDIIFNKPERHFFSVDDKTYIDNRYMNTTGG